MATAALQPGVDSGAWHVTSEGEPLADLATHREGNGAVVTAQIFGHGGEAERIRPYRFDHPDAAEAFVRELVVSFSYLGCHVSRA